MPTSVKGAPPVPPPTAAAAADPPGWMGLLLVSTVRLFLCKGVPERMTTGWPLDAPPPSSVVLRLGARMATNGWLGLLGDGTSWNRGASADPTVAPAPADFMEFGTMLTDFSLDFIGWTLLMVMLQVLLPPMGARGRKRSSSLRGASVRRLLGFGFPPEAEATPLQFAVDGEMTPPFAGDMDNDILRWSCLASALAIDNGSILSRLCLELWIFDFFFNQRKSKLYSCLYNVCTLRRTKVFGILHSTPALVFFCIPPFHKTIWQFVMFSIARFVLYIRIFINHFSLNQNRRNC